jgi:general secretion pathway protein D
VTVTPSRPRPRAAAALLVAAALSLGAGPSLAQQQAPPPAAADPVALRGDSVSVRFVDTDVRAVVQALARYLDRPVVFGVGVQAARVTIETPRPVPRGGVAQFLRGVLESQNLELVADSSGLYRVRAKPFGPDPATLAAQARAQAPPPVAAPAFYVIRLSHARAADVAATVNALYGRASALGELGSTRAPTLSQGLAGAQIAPYGVGATVLPNGTVVAPPVPQSLVPPGSPGVRPSGSTPTSGAAGLPATLTGETVIIPDPGTNSLLIRANPDDYALITAAVRQIDVRPLQVLIEVIIAEVRRNRSFDFGVGFDAPPASVRGHTSTTTGVSTNGGPGTGQSSLGSAVIRIMHAGGGVDFTATLTAAAQRGDAKILSRPVVIAANNEPAQILVGSQRPFIQVSRTLNSDSRDQVVQYRDVGTKLTVTPTISADGYVSLDVTQEVNQATSEQAFDAPVISTRTVQTRLLVRDSQTVVLGGISDRQREVDNGGVPVLSGIPGLGWLFGRTTHTSNDTEFFLFITPRILRDDAGSEAVTKPYAEKAKPATQ